jgi:redox-sensing transcriptional repressor
MKLPQKTVERLSQYRRILYSNLDNGKEFIYSHEIASQLHLTPVQVRRDIMLIGYTGTQRKGYVIKELVEKVALLLDGEKPVKAVVIGMGNLGKAITSYFNGKRTKIEIAAAFDVDEQKVNRVISNVHCFHINELKEKIDSLDVSIAILTLSPEFAQSVADQLIIADIKGILNFTSIPLNIPEHIYVEDYDMVTSIEKVAYFVNHNS